MIKILKYIIKDILLDIKWLFITIKRIIKGDDIVDKIKWYDFKNEMRNLDYLEEFKSIYPYLIVILFAVVCGIFIGAKYYEMKCNNFIYDNYVYPQIVGELSIYPGINITGFNSSLSSSTPKISTLPD